LIEFPFQRRKGWGVIPRWSYSWFFANETLLGWMAVASLGLLILGAILLPVVIVQLPSDLLLAEDQHQQRRFWNRSLQGRLYVIARNLLGGLFLLAGIAMLLTPGQGIVSIIVGLGMMDFPRKRAVLVQVARRERILRTINRLRRRFGREPIKTPEARDS